MANQVIVTSNNTVQVSVEPTPNVQVTISRTAVGTIANVSNANYANFAGTAFNVSGSNVTGAVANATFATTASSANTANSATVAASANSVTLANVSGAGNIASINLDGNVSNILTGSGTFVAIPTVSANANYANFAGTAFSVAGANVSGTVANATYAANAGFATTAGSANTANSATVANSANSVAGANVSGTVANATYADNAGNANFANSATVASSANSVTLANVSGAGNIASINLDGSSSNVLRGDGTFAPEGSSGNANYANFAGTVLTNAQPNITSVGTLTALTANATTPINVSTTNGNVSFTTFNNANTAGRRLEFVYNNPVTFQQTVFGAKEDGFDYYIANSNPGNTSPGNIKSYWQFLNNGDFRHTVGGSGNVIAKNLLLGNVFTGVYNGNIIAGNVTLNAAGTYSGNAAGLTNIPGANVTGTVPNANVAVVAASANSVTLANVSGAGNIASINLDGNASNLLTGNGTFVAIPTDVANANYANFAGTVLTNAQPNITSVGNLTSLAVTGNVSANAYQLTTSPGTLTAATGQMVWSAAEQTMNLGMNYGVTQQVGLETYVLIKASATINDGQVIMFTGANGDNILGAPADTTSVGFRPEYIIGVATQNIANNDFGYVTVFGVVQGLNTNAYNVGDILWVDNTTPGALTATRPSDPNYQIEVAAVTKKSGGDGRIQVRVTAFNDIDSLTDVTTTTPSNGQALVYSGNIWVNGNPEQANIANIAYSVAAANVSGLGNIATINLDGNVSNLLTGNGTFVAIPTGGANANYANFAGDVINATQSNITTVGTLTNATVSNTGNIRLGNIIINETSNVSANVLNQLTVASNVVGNSYRALAIASGNISDLTGITDVNVFGGALNLTAGNVGNTANRITTTTANITGGAITIRGGSASGGNNTGRTVTTQPVNIQSGAASSLTASTTTVGNINITGGALTFASATTVGSAATGGVNIVPTTILTDQTAANISATTVNIPAAGVGFGRFNILTSNTAITNVTTPLVNFGGAFGLAMGLFNGVSNVVVNNFTPLDQVYFRTGGVGPIAGITGGNLSNISIGNITTAQLTFDTGSWLYPTGPNVSNVSAGNVTTGDVNIRTGFTNNVASVTGTYNRGNIKLNAKNVILEAGITSNTSGTGTFIFDGNNTATLGNLVVSNYFSGNGSLLTGITATNANYANFAGNAFSVDAANVTGLGNIATINLDGNVSNLLTGNGTFVAIPTGGANANYANFAGDVVNSAQSNITSLGTLTGLTVSGTSNVANTQLNSYQETTFAIGNVSGTITPDFNNGSIQSMTLTGNITLNSLGNAVAGRSMTLILTQDGTGGKTLTSSMLFAGASKTLSTAAAAIDVISLFYDGTTYYASLSKGYA